MTKKEMRAAKIADMNKLNELAVNEKRSFTEDENAQFVALESEVRQLTAEIEAEERSNAINGFSTSLPTNDTPVAPAIDEGAAFRSFLVEKNVEKRDLSVGSNGGALAPEQFVAEVIKAVEAESPVYARIRKFPLSGAQDLGVPYESADATSAAWTAEVPSNEISADNTLAYGKRTLAPVDLTKLIKVSRKLIKASAIPVDTLITEKLSDKMSAAYENGVLNGTGSGQPLGIFTASANGVPTTRDVSTTSSLADDLIKVKMSLDPTYRRNAVWIMSASTIEAVAKLKGSDGQFIWHESLRDGEPATLLGLPVVESAYAPAFSTTSGDYIAALADLNYYWFAYNGGIEIQTLVEKFAGTNQVGYLAHALADGAPVLAKAFARLVVA